MDLDLNLSEEAPSHGPSSGGPTAPQPLSTPTSTTTTTASSSTSTPTRDALDQELASRSVADDQRARYGAFSAAAPGEGPSDAAQRAAAAFQASTYGTAPAGDQPATPQKPGELSAGPSPTAERMPVPLQPRPTSYAQFQAAGGTSGMGVPLRPAAGKARSNSWSYPASAVAPYAIHPYVASTAGASGIGTGMPAPGPAQPRANRTTTYRQRGGSLSFSSPEEAMRQQYLQQQQAQQQQGSQMFLPYAAPQPTSQPQPMMAQDSSFLGYGGGGGVGDGGGFLSAYQQQSTQPVAAAQSTPPLPTTPSSFIRRTSLPQTYLHTIPISRSASGFTPASTDTALPILAQPQTTEVHQKLEIPTHGARALPKEIATHPAIQSITKAQSDSQQATGEAAAEKEVGVEITGEEGEAGGGVQPSEGKFVDISEYLNLPQSKVAKTLGIPSSTLSKRWKEAARARKWPWRTVCKIDKEIMALLHNIPPSVAAKGPEHVPPEIHTRLLALLKQRQDELKPVIIRL